MDIKMSGKNVKLTEGMKEAIYNSLTRLSKYLDEDSETRVLCSTDAGIHRIEVTILYKGKLIRGESKTNDMYVSINNVIDDLERKIRKYKTKILKNKKGSIADYLVEKEENEESKIVIDKVKHYDLKPMYPEDACLQMELLGHDFYVFVNAETDGVCVVYKRHNGYGLIISE